MADPPPPHPDGPDGQGQVAPPPQQFAPPQPQPQRFAPPQMPMPVGVELAMRVAGRMAPRPMSPNRRLIVQMDLQDAECREARRRESREDEELRRAMDGAAILRVRRQLHRLELEQNEDQRRQADREERRQAALIAYLRARLDARTSDETGSP